MRLTNTDRESIITAILQDTPQVDYTGIVRKIVEDKLYSIAPKEVRTMWDMRKKGTLDYDLGNKWVSLPSPSRMLYSFLVPGALSGERFLEKFPEIRTELAEISDKAHAQQAGRCEMRAKLKGLFAGVTTLKQAKEQFPEFEKYLPKEREKTRVNNLLAVSNVVADLSKMGWPKEKK